MKNQHHHQAVLGTGQQNLLFLTEIPSATRPIRATGLYHFSLLVSSRPAIASFLQHMIETQTELQAFAKHLVSEAIYLADPDGNGIEIYRDHPRKECFYLKTMQLK